MTGRRLAIYYTDCDGPAQIDQGDDKYLLEVLRDCHNGQVDLLLETNGGFTDATEKVVSILRSQTSDLRVIVPKRAKSNGTLIALAAKEIVMGACSELGPIDPNIVVGPGQVVPAQFIVQSKQPLDPIITQAADYSIRQTQKLATDLLKTGMMSGRLDGEIADTVNKLSTRDVFHSHGSVIDHREARALGLNACYLAPGDRTWECLWLLRCMYEHDARRSKVTKIFESCKLSSSIRQA